MIEQYISSLRICWKSFLFLKSIWGRLKMNMFTPFWVPESVPSLFSQTCVIVPEVWTKKPFALCRTLSGCPGQSLGMSWSNMAERDGAERWVSSRDGFGPCWPWLWRTDLISGTIIRGGTMWYRSRRRRPAPSPSSAPVPPDGPSLSGVPGCLYVWTCTPSH